jgi:hypothetical protein
MCSLYPRAWEGVVQGMRKSHAVLAALAMLVGFGSAFAVDAASYRDIGTVAEGVYVAHGDAGTFKVQAVDAVSAIIYDENGELLLARNLGAGEARTFVVGEAAVVAIAGGEAKVSAKGEGAIQRIGKQMRTIPLDESSGPVDEAFTVRMPPFLVGLQGKVQGEATDLVVEITSSKGLVYKYDDGEVQADLSMLTKEPMDARITASSLEGRIVLDVWVAEFMPMEHDGHAWAEATPSHAPKPPKAPKEKVHAEAHGREHRDRGVESVELNSLEGAPLRLALDGPGSVTFDIVEGWGFDASLYDASGTMVQYVQRGATVAESREGCSGFMGCFRPRDRGMGSAVDAEQVTWDLDQGEYVLFVRLAHVDGVAVFGNVRAAEPLEPHHLDLAAEDGLSLALDVPVLDVMVWDGHEPSVERSISVLLNGASAYEARSRGSLFGQSLEREVAYDPSVLGMGLLEVAYDGQLLPGLMGETRIVLLLAGEPTMAEADDGR